MTESTNCHYSSSGCSKNNSSVQLLGNQKSTRMKRAQKVISILFKAMNYGQNQGENFDNSTRPHQEDEETRRPPSAPSGRNPPIIRIKRERSLNGVVWGSPQQLTTTSDSANTTIENTLSRRSRKRQAHHSKTKKHDSDENHNRSPSHHGSHEQVLFGHEPSIISNSNVVNHLHSSHPHLDSGNHLKVDEQGRHHRRRNLSSSSTHNINNNNTDSKDDRNNNHSENSGTASTSYSPEAERFVKAAIDKSRPVERQVIRIINGNEPSIQSQVLLNTKTSQPWDDLVRDLGMAVKLAKKRKSHMETISGRRIQSYSQLRSELLAGTHAFYIYSDREEQGKSELGTLNETFTLVSGQNTRSRRTERQDNYYMGTQPQLSQSYNTLPTIHYNNSNINIQNQIHKSPSSISVPGPSISRHGSHENIRKSSMKIPTGSSTNLNTKSSIAVKRTSSTNRLQTSSSNTVNPSSRSNPNLLSANYIQTTPTTTTTKQPRHRSTRRRRSEASVYLASASRSRSLSPD